MESNLFKKKLKNPLSMILAFLMVFMIPSAAFAALPVDTSLVVDAQYDVLPGFAVGPDSQGVIQLTLRSSNGNLGGKSGNITMPAGYLVNSDGSVSVDSAAGDITYAFTAKNQQLTNDITVKIDKDAPLGSKQILLYNKTSPPGSVTSGFLVTNGSIGDGITFNINPLDLYVNVTKGSVTINDGADYTNSSTVSLDLSADDLNGVTAYRISNSTDFSSATEISVTSSQHLTVADVSWNLSAGEGIRTVYVQFKDTSGNWFFTAVGKIAKDTITVDQTAPTNGSISINNGDYTNSASVTLTLHAEDSVSKVAAYRISNSNDFATATEYAVTPTASTFDKSDLSWTLSAGADGTRTVYAWYKDGAGNWTSAAVSDSIILDTTAPTNGSVTINGGDYTNSTSVTLTLHAEDSLSNVAAYRISNSNDFATATEYAVTPTASPLDKNDLSWTLSAGADGTRTVYAWYKDGAGNWTSALNDSIVFDTAAPINGSVTINGGDYANSTSVTLTLHAEDSLSNVAAYRISNSNDFATATEYAVTPTASTFDKSDLSWTLSAGADGTRTVYAWYKDGAGNWTSAEVSDSIVLDTAAPINGSVTINGGDYANSTSVTLTLHAEDSLSNVAAYRISNSNDFATATEYAVTPTASTFDKNDMSWTLSAGADGTRTVYAWYKDGAGNWTSALNDSIVLDTAAPINGSVTINGGEYTNSTSVTLTLHAEDSLSNVAAYRISNSNDFATATEYAVTPTASTFDKNDLSWTLSAGADGTRTVYVWYKDSAGNWTTSCTDTITLSTTPTYALSGFLSPVTSGDKFKRGSVIPFKFNMTASDGSDVSGLAPRISYQWIGADPPPNLPTELVSAGTANTDNIFRYLGNGQFIYNLSTKNLPSGHYLITATCGTDSTSAEIWLVR